VTGDAQNTKTTTNKPTAIGDNPKVKNSKLKKAIIPKASSATPTSRQPTPGPPSQAAASLLLELRTAIQSAETFRELPLPYRDAKAIKKFRMTCYSGWMASSDMFGGFTVDSPVLLGIVQTAFASTWPDSPYVPCQQDIFHQIVSTSLRVHSVA
jgi:hypothetical protein